MAGLLPAALRPEWVAHQARPLVAMVDLRMAGPRRVAMVDLRQAGLRRVASEDLRLVLQAVTEDLRLVLQAVTEDLRLVAHRPAWAVRHHHPAWVVRRQAGSQVRRHQHRVAPTDRRPAWDCSPAWRLAR
jgi:hypothetical protein